MRFYTTCTRVSAKTTTDTEYLEPSLTSMTFVRNGPFVIIDCSQQNHSIKCDRAIRL